MTNEFTRVQHLDTTIWWLQHGDAHQVAAGLMYRGAPLGRNHRDEDYEWCVARWAPEEFIAHLPADMPEAEAMDAAKTLILLSLKEKE